MSAGADEIMDQNGGKEKPGRRRSSERFFGNRKGEKRRYWGKGTKHELEPSGTVMISGRTRKTRITTGGAHSGRQARSAESREARKILRDSYFSLKSAPESETEETKNMELLRKAENDEMRKINDWRVSEKLVKEEEDSRLAEQEGATRQRRRVSSL